MQKHVVPLALLVVSLTSSPGFGQAAPAPAAANPAVLCLETRGPLAYVTSLAFSPDGQRLYAAGYDKVVRVWQLSDRGQFEPVQGHPGYRVPIGPGMVGAINALAVSPDGRWLAVGGLGLTAQDAGFKSPGFVQGLDTLSEEAWLERGAIHLFNTDPWGQPAVRRLRGHRGPILALAFADDPQQQRLLSAGMDYQPSAPGHNADGYVGVVRLWDVAELKTLATFPDPLFLGSGRPPQPGLAARSQNGEVQAAIAWGDGELRLWNVQANANTPSTVERGADKPNHFFGQSLAIAGDRLCVTAWWRGGQLRTFTTPPQWRAADAILLQPPTAAPLRCVAFAATPDGPRNHVAVLCRQEKPGTGQPGYGLQVIRLTDKQTIVDVPIPTDVADGLAPPLFAVAPHGRHLAIAGGKRHAILCYAIEGLLKKDARPTAVAQNVGAAFHSIAFVQQGNPPELALALNRRPPDAAGRKTQLSGDDLVLDFARRSLGEAGKDCTLVAPEKDGWNVTLAPAAGQPARWTFQWRGPGRAVSNLALSSGRDEQLTGYVLLPPLKPRTDPILAVASWDAAASEPKLRLVDLRSGRSFRNLSGHLGRIHALAATPDGKLLASTADDETTCLWSLTDVGEIVGKHGTLPRGLGFREQGAGQPLVAYGVDKNDPAQQDIRQGDVLEAVTFKPGGTPRSFTSVKALYAACWDQTQPDQEVELRLLRAGQVRTVKLKTGQFMDERKPLLSLFVTRERDQQREWIAWTPAGPYDCSGPVAEEHLGWHTNPAQPDQPATFAGAGQYRGVFFKPKLLKPLLEHGDLSRAEAELALADRIPEPRIGAFDFFQKNHRVEKTPQGVYLVRDKDVQLQLKVEGPSLTKRQLQSATVAVAGQQHAFDLDQASGETLAHDLPLPPRRGDWPIRVRLQTTGPEAHVLERDLATVRFVPPPPEIRWAHPEAVVVEQDQFECRAQVVPSASDQAVTVRLSHNGQRVELPPGSSIQKKLQLVEGKNTIELEAANADAPGDALGQETARRTLVVAFKKRQKLSLFLQAVAELDQPQSTPHALVAEPKNPGRYQATVVAARRVVVRGAVQAGEPLTGLKRTPAGPMPLTIPPLAMDKPAEFTAELDLKPGAQSFRFRAETQSEAEECDLTLDYRPLLPTLHWQEPKGVIAQPFDAPREVPLQGRFEWPKDRQRLAIVVALAGREVQRVTSQELTPDLAAGRFGPFAKVRLAPGTNHIRLLLKNEWGREIALERVVELQCQPRLLSVTGPSEVRGAYQVDLDVVVATLPTSQPPTITINGEKQTVEVVAKEETPEQIRWRLTAKNCPLKTDKNLLRVRANSDGAWSQEEKRHDVEVRPKQPPPVIDVLAGDTYQKPAELAVDRSEFTLAYRVRSSRSKLLRVSLTRSPGKEEEVRLVPPAQLPVRAGPDGHYELLHAETINLQPGLNTLVLKAANEDAESAAVEWIVNYVQPPFRLVIDPIGEKNVHGSILTFEGYVAWKTSDEEKQVERGLPKLRVFVNGFRQRDVQRLEKNQNKREWHFAATVVLNRKGQNYVDVDCPDLPLMANPQQHFTVECAQPEEPKTLHVLVVGNQVKGSAEVLRRQVFQALNVIEKPQLHSRLFARVFLHPQEPLGMLAGNVERGTVRAELKRMAQEIKLRNDPNVVVLVYWLGAEPQRHQEGLGWLPTDESAHGGALTDTAVALDELVTHCDRMLGAPVLLFDFNGTPQRAGERVRFNLAQVRSAILRSTSSTQHPLPQLLPVLKDVKASVGDHTTLRDLALAVERLSEPTGLFFFFEDNLKGERERPLARLSVR